MKKVLVLIFLLAACSPHHDTPVNPEIGATVGDGGEDTSNDGKVCTPDAMEVVEFADVKKELFDASCTQCHSPGSGLMNLTDYESVKSNLAQIKDSIDKGRMPVGGTLTNEQKNILAQWINIGAPEVAMDIDGCEE